MPTSNTISTTSLSIVFYFLSGLSASVYANLAITSPVNSIWEAGTKNLITWTETGEGAPAPATFALDLMQGPATSLQLVQSITKNTDAKEGQHSWEIPKTLPPGNYSLRAGSPPNVVYSTYFEIKGPGSGGASPSTPPATPSKTGKKHEKGVKKTHHDDQAKKSSGAGGPSSANTTTITTATTALPPGTTSVLPITVQKPNNTTTSTDHKASPSGTSDQKASPPSSSNVLGPKKAQENVGILPRAQFIGFLMCLALGIYSYFH